MTTATAIADRHRSGLPTRTLALAWLLWLWIALAIVGAFVFAPPAGGFQNAMSSRILFFHVPMAWGSFVAFIVAGAWSLLYLARGRRPRHDLAAAAAVELGLVYCLLATLSGALWSRLEWGAFWNWDPRQTSIVLALVFYAAYLALRGAIDDGETRGRLAAAYAVLGLVVAPFLFFVLPRLTFSLHPEPVLNSEGQVDMDGRILAVLLAASSGFTVLFFWLHNLAWRLRREEERNGR
ncbi:MAG TPA: cytochrome c biogenesis protein CcsA [Thermoanaerobaculia bacterium]|nr:cytochrome c biogenesis protein CcsA [Thermoanaerobaculia bacterium]